MQFNYSTPVKETQPLSKPSKSHTQTREGDWVCFNCSNLNFSFRKKCNRCKTQTRKQNQDLQNAYTIYFYNQQEANMYNCENQQIYMNEQMYYVSDAKSENGRKDSFNEVTEQPLSFSRNNQNNQVIEVTITSPFKELENLSDFKLKEQNLNKKLRTPSSKKKKTLKKKNDMLPSVSPLLKKLLAKEETTLSTTKDPLNVALFYDEIWDNNKQNLLIQSYETSISQSKNHLFLTNSGKKALGNSRMHNTNDSVNNLNIADDDGFAFLMRSPEREYNDDDEIIEIDEGDEELAQIIRRIIV